MPKGVKKVVEIGELSAAPQPDYIADSLSKITSLLESLTARVDGLEKSKGETTLEVGDNPTATVSDSVPVKNTENEDIVNIKVHESSFPVPQDYKDLVAQILNSHFGININSFADRPQFQFEIIVPRKYSTLSEQEYTERGADIRSQVLTYADGLNGVRLWCEKIYSSFNPEVKSQITQDRI